MSATTARGFELEATLRGQDNPTRADILGTSYVHALLTLPDSRVLSVCEDAKIRVYRQGTCVLTMDQDVSQIVLCVAVLSPGRVISGNRGGKLQVWDTTTGSCQTLVGDGHAPNDITCLTVLPNRNVVTGADNTLKCFDVVPDGRCRCLHYLERIIYYIRCLLGISNELVVAGCGRFLMLWDPSDGRGKGMLEGHRGTVSGLAVVPGSDRLVSSSHDRTVVLWDLSDGLILRTMVAPSLITAVAALPDGRVTGASLMYDGEKFAADLTFWNPNDGRCLQELHAVTARQIDCVAILPEGRLMTGSNDGSMRVLSEPHRDGEKQGAKEVARKRACTDVEAIISKFL